MKTGLNKQCIKCNMVSPKQNNSGNAEMSSASDDCGKDQSHSTLASTLERRNCVKIMYNEYSLLQFQILFLVNSSTVNIAFICTL